jgi:hypothetical protein
VKKYALCIALLSALPVSATISYVRSNTQWSGGTSSCAVGLTSTGSTDLVIFWSEWQTPTGTPNTITVATALDSQVKGVSSAVGPTVQAAATKPTAGQIFYVKNVNSGGETITVTFSGTVFSSACVIVEFSGADINNPLDSISAGYSLTGAQTGLLDSGNVAPANSNLLIFGGGTSDNGTATIGTGFTLAQKNGGSVTEYAIASGNNTLQRATAILTPSLTTGNWLMQMAVFRDGSWTVTGAWSPARPAAIRYADQFPGNTADAKIANAVADLPSTGGVVDATGLQGPQQISTTVNIPQGVTVALGATTLQSSACPAFSLVGTGATLSGMTLAAPRQQPSVPIVSPTVIQAATGCTGPLVQFNISSGEKGGWIHDLMVDINSITTVTAGITECGHAAGGGGFTGAMATCSVDQVDENLIENVSVGNTGAYLTTGQSCVNAGCNVQSLYIEHLHCSQVWEGLAFGFGNARNISVSHSRIEGCSNVCFQIGDGGATQSQDVKFYDDDIETGCITNSGTQCTNGDSSQTGLGLVYNVEGFSWFGGRAESDAPSNYTTALVLGETGASATNVTIMGVDFIGDYNNTNCSPYTCPVGASYAIAMNNVIYPTIIGNLFSTYNSANQPIANNYSSTCAVVLGNAGANGALPVSSTTGICFAQGNNIIANDYTMVDQLEVGNGGAEGAIYIRNGSSGKITVVPPLGALGMPQLIWPDQSGTLGETMNAGTGIYLSARGVTGCTTGATIGSTCTSPITVTWPGTFSGTNYSAGCGPSGAPSSGFPSGPYVVSKSANSMTVNYAALTNVAASWSAIDCWAIQD